MDSKVGKRAVILGGSVAGLFAASAVEKSFDEVVIVDRDDLVGVREARRGAPQARHINGLLARGARAMEDLFPEITAEMVSAGCPITDLAGTVRWYFGPRPLRQTRAGLTNVAATRPILEFHLRERVQAMKGLRFLERHDITGIATTPDRSRVIGARVRPREGGAEEVLDADLVIDASGRGSRAALWLESLGYGVVPEEEEGTRIGLGYGTRHYRLGATDPFGKDHSIVSVANPMLPRGAIFTKTDGGKLELTTYGILGDHPPMEVNGFNAFVKTLAAKEIYPAIVDAEPLDEPVLYKFPTTMWRRFDRLPRLPEGFLIMGDAVCTPNPVFAQAQTLAALEALSLRDRLSDGTIPSAVDYQRDVAAIIKPAWDMTTAINLTFPGVEGRRPPSMKLMQRYMMKVMQAATLDSSITEAFMRAAGLVDPLESLMRPSMVWRVLRTARLVG
jgi:2-polyprenyl-6-methoxyphenol hydroxylase-like FAD-dependent oxidoreductase